MARPVFWPSDDSQVLGAVGLPVAASPVRIWTAQTGGSQVVDLQYVNAAGTPTGAVASGVLYSDADGFIPAFAGPDGGPRTLWGDHGFHGRRLALSAEPGATGGGGVTGTGGGTVTTTAGIAADAALTGAFLTTATLPKYPDTSNASVVPRPVKVDLRDWGVTADGATDDAPAINAAMSASGAPKHVLLPRGRVRLSTPILLADQVTIEGLTPDRSPNWTGWSSVDTHTVLIPDPGVDAIRGLGQNTVARNLVILLSGSGSAGRMGINGRSVGQAAFAFPRQLTDTGTGAHVFECTFENIGVFPKAGNPAPEGAAFWFERMPYTSIFKNISWGVPFGFIASPYLPQTIAAGGVDAATDAIGLTGHGFTNGQAVAFWWDELFTTYSPGFRSRTMYYVVNATTDTFQIAATNGGSPLNITATSTAPTYVGKANTYSQRAEGNRFDGLKASNSDYPFVMFNMIHNEFSGTELYPVGQGFTMYGWPSSTGASSNANRGLIYQEGPSTTYNGRYYSIIEGDLNTLELSHGPLNLVGDANDISGVSMALGGLGQAGAAMGAGGTYRTSVRGRSIVRSVGKMSGPYDIAGGSVELEATGGGATNIMLGRRVAFGNRPVHDFQFDPMYWLERAPSSRIGAPASLWTPGNSLYLTSYTTADFDTTWTPDPAADTGLPLRLTRTDSGNSTMVPATGDDNVNEHLVVGTNFPAGKGIFYIRLKADSAVTANIAVGYGVSSFTTLASVTAASLTTAYQVFAVPYDYTGVTAGTEVSCRIGNMSSIVPRTIDWVAWVPARESVRADKLVLSKLTMEPADKTDGMIAYADGTTWNPGSGQGMYRYTGSAWVSLG